MTDTTDTRTLAQVRAEIRRDTKWLGRVDEITTRREANIKRAVALGATGAQLSEDTGLTPGRISQIAPSGRRGRPTKVQPDAAAEEPERAAYLTATPDDELPERFRPGSALKLRQLLAVTDNGQPLVTDRWGVKGPERATIFVDSATGRWVSVGGQTGQLGWTRRSAAELLSQLPAPVRRVYLVGARPQAPGVGDPAEACRVWFMEDVPNWAAGAHYLEDAERPIGRWGRAILGQEEVQEVEVLRADTWFGPAGYTVDQAAQAWAVLRQLLRAEPQRGNLGGFGPEALLLTTPSTTGRDLWRRSIGFDRQGRPKTWPVLSPELRQLIQSTSGQGRTEVVAEGPTELPGYTHWDMRFAYSALTWGMPVGAPTMVTGKIWAGVADEERDRLLKRRGRWLVTATVPDGWEHVGLLAAPASGSGDKTWTYPRHPGERFTTWTSGSELSLAARQGWAFTVHEGFHFAEGKPLNDWSATITNMYRDVEKNDDISPDLRELVRGALRLLILSAIGAFAARTRPITKSLPATRANEKCLPPDAPVRVVGDRYVWSELADRSGWSAKADHPEWSAEIWARCRARLLTSPTANPAVRAGALHVPPGTVLALSTDGISLGCDPGWTDDGAVGRFRLKGRAAGPVPRPVNSAENDALRRLSATALRGEAR